VPRPAPAVLGRAAAPEPTVAGPRGRVESVAMWETRIRMMVNWNPEEVDFAGLWTEPQLPGLKIMR
jgi:hypothetical protein